MQLIVSTCVLLATYHRADLRRHFADLLTPTRRPSPSSSGPLSSSRDVIDIRHRRDAGDSPGKPAALVNGVVKLYNCRRRQYVAVAPPRYDVTVTSRRNDVMASPGRPPRRSRSVQFSNQISWSSCQSSRCGFVCFRCKRLTVR